MDRNAEKNITTEQQKPSFKYLSSENIKLQRNYELFPYNVGHEVDSSLTSFFTAFSLSAGTGSYGAIQRKFYENQSITSDGSYNKIISSAYVNNNVGSMSSDIIFVFTTNSILHKDGISNINKEKNVIMNFSCVVYDYSLSSTIAWGLGDDRNINYIMYDRKISSTAGDIIMKILSPDLNSFLALSGTLSSDFTQYADLVVGKVFYDYGLIVLDSLSDVQSSAWTLSGNLFRYFVPYPVNVESVESLSSFPFSFNLTAGNIPFLSQDFNGIYFNRSTTAIDSAMYDIDIYDGASYADSASISGFFTSVYSPASSIILNNIEFNSKLNKNSYILEIPILQKDFNYSTHSVRIGIGDENIPEATEENPIWFNKIGLYDYKNNLLGVAKLNIPIKNSNKRTMIIKLKADY